MLFYPSSLSWKKCSINYDFSTLEINVTGISDYMNMNICRMHIPCRMVYYAIMPCYANTSSMACQIIVWSIKEQVYENACGNVETLNSYSIIWYTAWRIQTGEKAHVNVTIG